MKTVSLVVSNRSVLRVLSTLCLCSLLLTHNATATNGEGTEESGESGENAHYGPEFEFRCVGEDTSGTGFVPPTSSGPSGVNSQVVRQETKNHRPDMPSGDMEKEAYCWIENLNDYNITVELSAPPVLSILDTDYINCDTYGYRPWMWSDPCTYGRWLIVDGGHFEFELGPFEIVEQNWSIRLGEGVASLPPGINSIDISAKVTEFGDGDLLECPDSCTTIIQSSNHELGSWWRANWDGGFLQDGVYCGYDYYYYQYSWIADCDLELGGLDQYVFVSNLWAFCSTGPKYGNLGYNMGPGWEEQLVTTCEPSIDPSWQQLFSSSKLDQALMFHAGFDDRHMGANIGEIKPGHWDNTECPDNSIGFLVAPEYQGNVPAPDIWQVDVAVHGYNFSDATWQENVSISQFLNLSNLLESNQTGTIIDINLDQLIADTEHHYLFIEWIVRVGDSEFTSGIIGNCLTESGIAMIEEVIENSEFTMGQSGNPIERISNTVKFSVAVNGIVPISLFLAVIAITILFVLMTVFYRGKPSQKVLPSEKKKDETAPLSDDISTQGSIDESPEPKESPSTFWTIVWIICFIFPPLLLLAVPVYLVTGSSIGNHSSDKLNHNPANQGEFSIPEPIQEHSPENGTDDKPDVPWWEIDKVS